MKILVTGGAGYIGSHTTRLLLEKKHDVMVLDTLENGYQAAVPDQARFVKGSTHDSVLVTDLLSTEKIEAVIHFAAYKAAGESVAEPGKYFLNNSFGTMSLMESMVKTNVPLLVFSSTAAVYGNPSTLPAHEELPIQPENPYGESKAIVERMLPWYEGAHGLKSVALRYFNVAGAWQDGSLGEDPSKVGNLIPLVLQTAAGSREMLKIYGKDYQTPDGTAIRDYILRDYIHVLDLANGHLAALNYLAQGGASKVINLGTGNGNSVQEVVNQAEVITGKKIPVAYTDRRPGDPAQVWADNTKAKKLLKWTPQYGLKEILETAWKWQTTHPNGFPKG
jgi:UDP-glucose 4-epimerase